MKTVKDKQIVVGADFAGYPLKEAVVAHLKAKGWKITDLGVTDPNVEDTELMFHRIGLRVVESDGEAHLRVDPDFNRSSAALSQALTTWRRCAAKLEAGEIARADYDNWRYNYPWYDVPGDVPSYVRYDPETGAVKVKMTPPEVSDMLMAELKKQRKKKK